MKTVLRSALLLLLGTVSVIANAQLFPFGYLVDSIGQPLRYGVYSAQQIAAAPSGLVAYKNGLILDPTGATIPVGVSSFAALTGNIAISQMNNGTGATGTTFWSGDGTFKTVAAAGGGTVTTFSCVTANGVSCSVANAGSAPAATFTLGAIAPSTINGNTITAGTGTLNLGTASLVVPGIGGTVGSAAYTNTSAYTSALVPTTVKTAPYTAAPSDLVPVDTTSGSVTVTLPTAPANGSLIAVKQIIRGGTNTVSVVTGGSDVFNRAGGPTTATITLTGAAQMYQYNTTGAIWFVVADDMPYASLLANLQTWSGQQTLTNPIFTTPTLGVAAATTVNKVTITTPATSATLTIPDGVTLNAGVGGTIGALGYLTPGTGNATALGVNTGSAGAFVVNGGALGTPASGNGANLTGISLTAGVSGTLPVTSGGTGVATGTTAYGLLAAGTTATGAFQTLTAGATTDILVGGGASALPAWTTATGTGAPMRAGSPTTTGTFTAAAIAASGNISTSGGSVSDSKGEVRTLIANAQSTAYTTLLTDCGKQIQHPTADTTARTFTIDSNANVAAPVGCMITFSNQVTAGVITVAITSDTMYLAGAGTTGSRTITGVCMATATKQTSTTWIISGGSCLT